MVLSSVSLKEVKSVMIPSSHKLLLGTLAGLTRKISDQGLRQRMSRKAESRKGGFCLTGALERCTECNPAVTSVYFSLKCPSSYHATRKL